MRLSRKYILDPELDEPIRKMARRGNYSTATMIVTVPIAAGIFGARFGDTAAITFDAVAVIVFLFSFQAYGRAVATLRLRAARKMKLAHRPDQVVAALQWFAAGWLSSRSIHDTTGEAHYTLGRAAKECGEEELVAYCKKFLERLRTGPWAKKASKL